MGAASDKARVGVDIGGTFTDVAVEHQGRLVSAKVLTTHAVPEVAILDGLAQVVLACGIGMAGIGTVIHGTTLATNALIERRGARTALITTQGFHDVIEMRTENRFELYDLSIKMPAALVARRDRHVVRERIDAQGRVLHPLDEAQVRRLAALIGRKGYESVAIGLIHPYVNQLASGMRVAGPAAIIKREATTIVSSSSDAVVQPDGCLLLRANAAARSGACCC